jgi:hypothetical protein
MTSAEIWYEIGHGILDFQPLEKAIAQLDAVLWESLKAADTELLRDRVIQRFE